MILGIEPKNQVISATRSGVMFFFSVKEQNKRVLNRSTVPRSILLDYFLFPSWNYAQGHDLNVFGIFSDTIYTTKACSISKKGPKEVNFMKELVEPLYISYLQALDLPQNLFPFPRTGHLKISLGPTQFLYSKFHGLLKLIFHTNQYNGA